MIAFVTNCGACCMHTDFSFWTAQRTIAGAVNSWCTIPKLFDEEASVNKTLCYETKIQSCSTTMAYTGQCYINGLCSCFSWLQLFFFDICGHKYSVIVIIIIISGKEVKIQEFVYRDATNVEPEMYDCTRNNWSHWNSNEKVKEVFRNCTRKTFDRFTTKDSYTRNITHNTESAERWGSLLVHEKYREEMPVTGDVHIV